MTALKQEVNKLSGIYPDFYVLVEWKAVGELVDALGGVEFDVPYDMHYDDPEQDLYIIHLSLAGDEEHITYRRFLQEIAVHELEKTGGKNNAAGKGKRKQK